MKQFVRISCKGCTKADSFSLFIVNEWAKRISSVFVSCLKLSACQFSDVSIIIIETSELFPYTGWHKKKNPEQSIQSIFQDFALINSYLFSPCWVEHLFLIIITPISSNLVENFLFYE